MRTRLPPAWRPPALLLALAFAWPALAAERAAPPAEIHPLLVTHLSNPSNPLWGRIARQAAVVSRLARAGPASPSPEAYLQDAALQGPAEALAAAAVSRIALRPKSIQALLEAHPHRAQAAAIAGFIEAAPQNLTEPPASAALDRLFDASAPEPSLELAGISIKRSWLSETLSFEGKPVELLGRGDMGAVYAHPRIPGAVLKAYDPRPEVVLFGMAKPGQISDEEERNARANEHAGIGMRYLGRSKISGVPVSVRERVYGETLESLIRDRSFGPAEYSKILAFLRRMARARVRDKDVRPPNLMIGRTLLDPSRRAYLVDGSRRAPMHPSWSTEQVFNALLNRQTTVRAHFDPNFGFVVTTKPFRALLDEGLWRGRRTTRWDRFKELLLELLESAPVPSR